MDGSAAVSAVSDPAETGTTWTPRRVHAATSFTCGFFPYSSLPQQLLLRARAKLLLFYFYSRQGLKLLLFYFWLLPRARAKKQLTTRTDSPPSSSTPPHPIRIHTRSRHELRSFTDRLTGPITRNSPAWQAAHACSLTAHARARQ